MQTVDRLQLGREGRKPGSSRNLLFIFLLPVIPLNPCPSLRVYLVQLCPWYVWKQKNVSQASPLFTRQRKGKEKRRLGQGFKGMTGSKNINNKFLDDPEFWLGARAAPGSH